MGGSARSAVRARKTQITAFVAGQKEWYTTWNMQIKLVIEAVSALWSDSVLRHTVCMSGVEGRGT